MPFPLDGGRVGMVVCARRSPQEEWEAVRLMHHPPNVGVHTTIPDPSSIEEEGR
jgi:hypothetical protein